MTIYAIAFILTASEGREKIRDHGKTSSVTHKHNSHNEKKSNNSEMSSFTFETIPLNDITSDFIHLFIPGHFFF